MGEVVAPAKLRGGGVRSGNTDVSRSDCLECQINFGERQNDMLFSWNIDSIDAIAIAETLSIIPDFYPLLKSIKSLTATLPYF